MERVHILRAVRIDPGDQRCHPAQVIEILPGDQDPRGARHRQDMEGVIGRPAGGHQASYGVDDALGVHDSRERGVVIAAVPDGHGPLRRGGGQGVTQRRVGRDEGRAGQVQACQFHHHLVGIGSTVEGAGAGAVVGLHLGVQQFVPGCLALGVEGSGAGLFGVGYAGGHRPGRHEDGRQVPEGGGADEQAGHNLVADAQQHRGVKGIVGQRHRRGHGDDIAREERQLHAGAALRDAITHGGHAAGVLGRGPNLAGRLTQDVGEPLIGLMGREHVVVGRDDGYVGRGRIAHLLLVAVGRGGEGVGPVGAGELASAGPGLTGRLHAFQIVSAGLAAAFNDAGGDLGGNGMHGLQSPGVQKIRRRSPA